MIKLTQEMMKNLSFPDYKVESMEFSRQNKTLKILVEGAHLDIDKGRLLERGVLFFSDWESITITIYDVCTNTLSVLEGPHVPSLEDLCEVIFSDQLASLRGFGFKSGWMEWNLVKPKMHAEFEDHNEEIYRNL